MTKDISETFKLRPKGLKKFIKNKKFIKLKETMKSRMANLRDLRKRMA